MGRFQETITVNAPAQTCYDQWLNFEAFPSFMDHVKSVTRLHNNLYHWVVAGPMGAKLEWDAQMDGKLEDRMISWHTVSEPHVGNQGAVLFEEIEPNLTQITSTFQYDPPAGPLGEIVAEIFSNPQQMVKQDLENFKWLLESASVSSCTY